jgi:hypothetical protein
MKQVRKQWIGVLVTLGVIGIGPSLAAQGSDQAALAKAAQNPVANMISVPFQNNTAFGWGAFDRTQNVLNIQPVVPITIGENVNLITRTIVPIISQPDIGSETGSTFGLGDVNATVFFSPAHPGKLIWGVGPAISLNTATGDVLGTGKWGIGPSVVLLTMPGNWVVGVLANNIWSVAGDENRADVNQMLVQYFVNYNLPNGWYLSSAPINTVNWEAASDKATIPLGGGLGKLFRLGRLPVNGSVQAYYNVVKPDAGPDWSMRIQAQLLFPR